MQTHKDLDVWKQSIDLVEMIYKGTSTFPSDEKFSIVSQMRRSSIAIPSNIAEGYARRNIKELVQFLYISLGSLSELETQLIISNRLKYLDSDNLEKQVEIIRKKLLNLIKYHKNKVST